MDLHDYGRAIRRSWIIVVVLIVVGGLAGFGYGRLITPTYQASTSVFVSAAQGATTDQLAQGSTFTQNTVASYSTLATTSAVLGPVIADLGLNTTPSKLASRISASTPLDTVFVKISVSDTSPARATQIANGVALSLRTVATQLAPKLDNGNPAVSLSIVAPAQEPTSPIKPNRRLIEFSGAGIGLIIGIILALIRFTADTRLRRETDYSRQTGRTLLGTVDGGDKLVADELLVATRPETRAADDYRRLAATLGFVAGDEPLHTLTVTSAEMTGRTTDFSLNLALALAERGLTVLVVDGDLRRGGVAAITGLSSAAGLTNVLAGSRKISTTSQKFADGVSVLTTGELLSNPSRALEGSSIARVVKEARSAFDLVIFDSPSIIAHSDALEFASATDATILVGRLGATTRQELDRAGSLLSGVRARNVEIVVVGGAGRPSVRPKNSGAGATPASKGEAARPQRSTPVDDEQTHDLALK